VDVDSLRGRRIGLGDSEVVDGLRAGARSRAVIDAAARGDVRAARAHLGTERATCLRFAAKGATVREEDYRAHLVGVAGGEQSGDALPTNTSRPILSFGLRALYMSSRNAMSAAIALSMAHEAVRKLPVTSISNIMLRVRNAEVLTCWTLAELTIALPNVVFTV